MLNWCQFDLMLDLLGSVWCFLKVLTAGHRGCFGYWRGVLANVSLNNPVHAVANEKCIWRQGTFGNKCTGWCILGTVLAAEGKHGNELPTVSFDVYRNFGKSSLHRQQDSTDKATSEANMLSSLRVRSLSPCLNQYYRIAELIVRKIHVWDWSWVSVHRSHPDFDQQHPAKRKYLVSWAKVCDVTLTILCGREWYLMIFVYIYQDEKDR